MKSILAGVVLISALAGSTAFAGTTTPVKGAPTPEPAASPKTSARYVYKKGQAANGKVTYHCFDTSTNKKVKNQQCLKAGVKKPN